MTKYQFRQWTVKQERSTDNIDNANEGENWRYTITRILWERKNNHNEEFHTEDKSLKDQVVNASKPSKLTPYLQSCHISTHIVGRGHSGLWFDTSQIWMCLYLMLHYGHGRCITTLIMVPINFWQNSDLFKKKEHFSSSNIEWKSLKVLQWKSLQKWT